MQSNLKTQYPLSPKKLTKKMLASAIPFFILAMIIGIPGAMGIQALTSPGSDIMMTLIFGILGGLFAFAIIMFIYSLYIKYYIKTYYYSDDEDFLTIKKGVFAPTEIHVQYLKIQDVFVDQDILDRILGIYDVHISSATYSSGIEAHIDGVDKAGADGLKNLFLGKMKRSSNGSQSQQFVAAPTSVDQSTDSTTSTNEPVKAMFSSPISSSVYGLSSNWWVSELVKLAIGSVTTPFFITLWFVFRESDNMTSGFWKFALIIWFSVFVIFVIYRSLYLFLWKKHYTYNFGEEYIYMKVGVLSVSEKNMGYNTIQDVKVNQSFIDRIFGVADVIIENASPNIVMTSRNQEIPAGANGIVIEGLQLADAQKVAEEVKKVTLSKSTNTKGI
ncbi:MAG: PH domain-containing protein [Patescibacteria group bacterium]